MLVAEITAATDAAGTLGVFYVSDDQFVTSPTDTPANTAFIPSIIDPGSLGIHTFGDGRTGGGATLELGEMVLANSNGQYDSWINYSFDGRPIIIRSGVMGAAYPDGFSTVFTGTIEGVEADWEKIVIRLRDKQYVFDRPMLTTKYAGNNVLPDGLEGTPADIKDKVKPRTYGRVFNVPPVPVNTSKLTYQVNDGPVVSISAVYDRGAALTVGADFATSTLLQAATPAAGSFVTCKAEGLFRLGSSPAGQVTADVEGALKTNLLASGEDFSIDWSYTNATAVADAMAFPKVGTTVYKLKETTTTSVHNMHEVRTGSNETVTFSVFAKAGERKSIHIGMTNLGALSCGAMFNLETGKLLSIDAANADYTNPKASIIDMGDGWRRCIFTVTKAAVTTSNAPRISLVQNSINLSYTGLTNYGAFITCAQLVKGTVAHSYQPSGGYTAPMVANIVSEIGYQAGLSDKEISQLDVWNTNSINVADAGIYVDDESSFQDCIDQLLTGIGGYVGFDSAGVMRMGILTAPSGTPVVTLYEYDIHEGIERRSARDNTIPTYRVTINHAKIYTTQPSDLAGVVTAARRAYLATEYRSGKAEDLTIKNQWLLATEYTQDTLLAYAVDASAEAARQLALYKVRRDIYDVPVQRDIFSNNNLKLMDVIKIEVPRFDLTTGKLFRIIGYRYELATNQIILQVWG